MKQPQNTLCQPTKGYVSFLFPVRGTRAEKSWEPLLYTLNGFGGRRRARLIPTLSTYGMEICADLYSHGNLDVVTYFRKYPFVLILLDDKNDTALFY